MSGNRQARMSFMPRDAYSFPMRKMKENSPSDSSAKAIVPLQEMSENVLLELNLMKEINKPSIQGAAKTGKRERSFDLSLPALVTGVDVSRNKFQEMTLLSSVSAQEATLWLDSRVLTG